MSLSHIRVVSGSIKYNFMIISITSTPSTSAICDYCTFIKANFINIGIGQRIEYVYIFT